MKGLLEKDKRMILQRKEYFLLFMAVAAIMGFNMDDSFIVSYLTMVGMIFAISVISYDEYDNGLPFLMTLPVSRREYAAEKHIFGYICLSLSWVAGMVLQLVSHILQHRSIDMESQLPGVLFCLGIFAIILSIMIPVELHFGSERSRIVMLVIFGGCFALGMLGTKIPEALHIDITSAAETIRSIPVFLGIAVGAAVTALIITLSIFISMNIMKRKEL